jgi:glutathione synthase/RimK-type ligase-like ATP-grasp enzyme
MVVIDDPDSIVKCTNKVYLAELLVANKIPAPRTRILHKQKDLNSVAELGYPLVLKIPDGSFSRGIYKAENADQLREYTRILFKESDLILAQEYLYTEYDWRIGILNNEPLFACQYFMSPSHWQIVKHGESGRTIEGAFKTWPISEAPAVVVKAAVNAARLIGAGLYGVDVKFTGKETYIIEINDNPNIESGVEDAVIGDELYKTILAEMIRRIERPQDLNRIRTV